MVKNISPARLGRLQKIIEATKNFRTWETAKTRYEWCPPIYGKPYGSQIYFIVGGDLRILREEFGYPIHGVLRSVLEMNEGVRTRSIVRKDLVMCEDTDEIDWENVILKYMFAIYGNPKPMQALVDSYEKVFKTEVETKAIKIPVID